MIRKYMSNKISKAVYDLVSVAKDTIISNVLRAVQSGELKIDKSQLDKLFSIIGSSVNDSYQNSIMTFMKTYDMNNVDDTKKNK